MHKLKNYDIINSFLILLKRQRGACMLTADRIAKLLRQENIDAECDQPLANYVTFRIGGPCRLLVKPKSLSDIQRAVALCKEAKMNYFVLGNGSDMLVSDAGYPGMILLTAELQEIELTDSARIRCGAGVPLSKLCLFAWEHALTGLEFAFGIPGSVGGAVYMNAGAYGGEIKDVLSSAEFLDEEGAVRNLPNQSLDFSYRHSLFSDSGKIILGAEFVLEPGDPAEIRSRMDDYLSRRKSKQPLEFPSAGSTFKRPEGNYASALIEQCGLKGYSIGGAQVSRKHSGFIINTGTATCSDVCRLIEHIQKAVFEKTGYQLECEVKKLGL